MDFNATTPLAPQVLECIYTTLKDAWGNPSSQHSSGLMAKSIINDARLNIAHMLGASSNDIIFTSGGTEANNMVLNTSIQHFLAQYSDPEIKDYASGCGDRMLPHIITSDAEHDSIRLVLEKYKMKGTADVTFVHASKLTGRVEPADVVNAMRPTTCLVTIMLANNETGIIQPIKEIVEHVRAQKNSSQILFHTDAAQAIGKISVDVQDLNVDYLTVVGHKFYGPRIGALYVDNPGKKTPIYPMFYGGGQEKNIRPGTGNTAMIAGLGKAAELVKLNLESYGGHMKGIRDYLESKLKEVFGQENIHINGDLDSERLPNTCNVSILHTHLTGSEILKSSRHMQASVGAACHSAHGLRASPILLALGIEEHVASKALRISVGRETTRDDIDTVINDIRTVITTNQCS